MTFVVGTPVTYTPDGESSFPGMILSLVGSAVNQVLYYNGSSWRVASNSPPYDQTGATSGSFALIQLGVIP